MAPRNDPSHPDHLREGCVANADWELGSIKTETWHRVPGSPAASRFFFFFLGKYKIIQNMFLVGVVPKSNDSFCLWFIVVTLVSRINWTYINVSIICLHEQRLSLMFSWLLQLCHSRITNSCDILKHGMNHQTLVFLGRPGTSEHPRALWYVPQNIFEI